MAKWLLEMKPTIDISCRSDGAFTWSCVNKHFEIAKWLLTIKRDIDVDEAFFFAALTDTWILLSGCLKSKPQVNHHTKTLKNLALMVF